MRPNLVKQKLTQGKTVVGCFLSLAAPTVPEICGYLGFDFIVVDCEHGVHDLQTAENMARGAEVGGAVPIVRVGQNEKQVILRYMDVGFLGIHLPQLDTAEEVRRAVSYVKYRPMGIRGLAGTRAASFGVVGKLSDYTVQANQETMVMVHIESQLAIENLPEMLQIPGVDVFFVGPTDLSQDMGITGQMDHPDLNRAIDRVIKLVRDAGKTAGILAGTAEQAKDLQNRGMQYLATSDTRLFSSGARQYLQQVVR